MLTAVLSVAALFAVYVLVKPRVGCSGDCGMCGRGGTEQRCSRSGSSEPDHG